MNRDVSCTSPHQPYMALAWFGLALLILMVDWWTLPFLRFPIFAILPIVLASWCGSRTAGLALSVLLPVVHYGLAFEEGTARSFALASLNTSIRVVVFGLLAFLVARTAAQTRELRVLRGLLPICCFCKRIRNHIGEWEALEHYITRHSEAHFTHSLCPTCGKRHYAEFLDDS